MSRAMPDGIQIDQVFCQNQEDTTLGNLESRTSLMDFLLVADEPNERV